MAFSLPENESQLVARAQEVINEITVDEERAKAVFDEVCLQIRRGLLMHKDCNGVDFARSDFMMLDTGVRHTPTGSETGVYYGLDMGGSNVRAIRVAFDGTGVISSVSEEKIALREVPYASELPNGVFDRMATASQLFDGVVSAVKKLMAKHDELGTNAKVVDVGFTCSFGIRQTTIDSAILTQWSKGFETGVGTNDPVIGQDVGYLVNQAFRRQNINARVNCILNDTLSTLLSGALNKSRSDPTCLVGAIVGTGFNVCYFEPEAPLFGYVGQVINTEAGGLCHQLPRCAADALVDFNSKNRGRQMVEKCISGLYLGECIRLMMLDILQDASTRSMWKRNSLPTADAAKIFNSNSLKEVQELVGEWMGRTPTSEESLITKCLVEAVFLRSATLVGIILSAFCSKTMGAGTDHEGVTIGVDGSLFILNPKYQGLVNEAIQQTLGYKSGKIVLTCANGGSCVGAALLAASTAEHGA